MVTHFLDKTKTRNILRIKHNLISLLLPPSCPICRTQTDEAAALCGTCWTTISFNTPPHCLQCGLPFEFDLGAHCLECQNNPPLWNNFVAALRYTDISAQLITQFKHNNRIMLLPLLSNWLLHASNRLPEPDLIIPMPIHRLRMWQRQFNQAAMLAQRLAELRGTPKLYAPLILQRIGTKPPQHGLSASQRRLNVQNVFRLNPKYTDLKNKHIWLIDDVATTGASLQAATEILHKAGAKISIAVVARVLGKFPNMTA